VFLDGDTQPAAATTRQNASITAVTTQSGDPPHAIVVKAYYIPDVSPLSPRLNIQSFPAATTPAAAGSAPSQAGTRAARLIGEQELKHSQTVSFRVARQSADQSWVDINNPQCASLKLLVRCFAPYLIQDSNDGFFPIAFGWAPRLKSPLTGKGTCRVIVTRYATGDPRHRLVERKTCAKAKIGDLKANQGEGQYLNYPAQLDVAKQRKMVNKTLNAAGKSQLGGGGYSKATNAYYFVSGRPHSGKPYTIQYWYYWTYNYFQNSEQTALDNHEGDLEHYDVNFDRNDRPVSVFMSRHSTKGHTYKWNSSKLQRIYSHVSLYAAHGDHALYEKCGEFVTEVPVFRDVTCSWPGKSLTVATPEDVRIDLRQAATGYSCWQGLYGEGGHSGTLLHRNVNGPDAFLRQSKVAGKVCG
jgi:hypothetical protein